MLVIGNFVLANVGVDLIWGVKVLDKSTSESKLVMDGVLKRGGFEVIVEIISVEDESVL